ncbi:hypothetical protein [Streptomyces viridosporus]|uniref:hypothetical protein n=1 Tax=Streptomyces viridosporus TaxID=67581 RepID=UPI00331D8531
MPVRGLRGGGVSRRPGEAPAVPAGTAGAVPSRPRLHRAGAHTGGLLHVFQHLARAAGLAVEALFSYAAHWRRMLAPLLGALEPKCDNTSCWRGVLREAAKYFAEGTNW